MQYYSHYTTAKKEAKQARIFNITIVSALIALALLLLISMGAVQRFAQQPTMAESLQWTVEYHVQYGDTLTAIAKSIPGADDHDIRALVHTIKEYNNMEASSLQAGQALVLPTTWKEMK